MFINTKMNERLDVFATVFFFSASFEAVVTHNSEAALTAAAFH